MRLKVLMVRYGENVRCAGVVTASHAATELGGIVGPEVGARGYSGGRVGLLRYPAII